MGAPELVQEIFTVIEGGADLGSASNIIQFPSDNGQNVFNVVQKTQQGANGVGLNYWVAAFVSGVGTAARALSAGAMLLTMEIPIAAALAAPALGISLGYSLYNLTPEFWDTLAEKLIDLGETIDGKIVCFMNELGNLTFSPEVIQAISDAFLEAGLYETGATWNGNMPESFHLVEPIISSTTKLHVGSDDYWYAGSGWRYNPNYTVEAICTNILSDSDDVIITSTSIDNIMTGLWCSKENPGTLFAFRSYIMPDLIFSGSGLGGVNSYTYNDKTVYYGIFSFLNLNNLNNFGTNPDNFTYANELAWILQYGEFSDSKESTQPGAILPIPGQSIRSLFPNWIWDFPPVETEPGVEVELPAGLPIEYPDILPKTEIVQDPAQNPGDNTEENPDEVIETIIENDPRIKTNPRSEAEEDSDEEADESDEIDDGGNGKDDTTEDPIDPDPHIIPTPIIPSTVLPSTVDSNKLFTVYNPSSSQLDSLGGYLWDNDLIDVLKRIWQNPLDGIIGLMQVYATPTTGSSHNIILGYLDSGVSAPVVTSQFVTIDCGSVVIDEISENPLDYTPYTQMQIYLPFIGIAEIDTNEFMNGTINVKYKVDVYTGSCIAEVKCTRTGDMPNGAILYTYNGNCSQQLPLTSGDQKGLLQGLISAAGLGLSVASGGALTAISASGMLNANISREMCHVAHSGNLSANAGIMGHKKPYVILNRKRAYNANNYNAMYGYPVNKTIYPGNHSGYFRMKAGRLRTSATEEEKNEILELLKNGVIL